MKKLRNLPPMSTTILTHLCPRQSSNGVSKSVDVECLLVSKSSPQTSVAVKLVHCQHFKAKARKLGEKDIFCFYFDLRVQSANTLRN